MWAGLLTTQNTSSFTERAYTMKCPRELSQRPALSHAMQFATIPFELQCLARHSVLLFFDVLVVVVLEVVVVVVLEVVVVVEILY